VSGPLLKADQANATDIKRVQQINRAGGSAIDYFCEKVY